MATTTFRALFDDLRSVQLSASELEIERVALVGGPALRATQDGRKLVIPWTALTSTARRLRLRLRIRRTRASAYILCSLGRKTRRGRCRPGHRASPKPTITGSPATIRPTIGRPPRWVTVPGQYFALSNGRLDHVDEDQGSGTKTYHWRLDVPHPAYLVTLVVGEFAAVPEHWDDIPVDLLRAARPRGKTRRHARQDPGDDRVLLAALRRAIIPIPSTRRLSAGAVYGRDGEYVGDDA